MAWEEERRGEIEKGKRRSRTRFEQQLAHRLDSRIKLCEATLNGRVYKPALDGSLKGMVSILQNQGGKWGNAWAAMRSALSATCPQKIRKKTSSPGEAVKRRLLYSFAFSRARSSNSSIFKVELGSTPSSFIFRYPRFSSLLRDTLRPAWLYVRSNPIPSRKIELHSATGKEVSTDDATRDLTNWKDGGRSAILWGRSYTR